jgi:hypothetical protein
MPVYNIQRHLLRIEIISQRAWLAAAEEVVSGLTKRSRSTSLNSSSGASKDSNNESGSRLSSKGDRRRPRAPRQKALSTKLSSHHWRHRLTVRALTPTNSRSRESRVGLGP